MGASRQNVELDGPGVYSFTKLEFYQQARSLAVDVFKMAKRFPRDDSTRVLTRQFVGAAISIRLNIAEGHGRYSRAAYRNHLSIARGSAAETADCLDLLASLGLISQEESHNLGQRCQRIIASLTRAMERLQKAQATQQALRERPPEYGTGDDSILDEYLLHLDDDAPMIPSSHAHEEDDDAHDR